MACQKGELGHVIGHMQSQDLNFLSIVDSLFPLISAFCHICLACDGEGFLVFLFASVFLQPSPTAQAARGDDAHFKTPHARRRLSLPD